METIGVRTKDDVYEQIDKASKADDSGGEYPGMSYEQGVKYALEWILGDIEDKPMEDN